MPKSDEMVICSCCGFPASIFENSSGRYLVCHKPPLCDECLSMISENLREQKKVNTITQGLPTFNSVIKRMKKAIKGQDTQIEELTRAVYHNYACMNYNGQSRRMDDKVNKQNILIVGPTGVGKTKSITLLCDILRKPYTIFDATDLTQVGYVGKEVDDIFLQLIEAANEDIELAQKGIVVLDEGDKKAAKSNAGSRDISGEDVLNLLLKKLEGCTISLGKNHIPFDTSNITFIYSGVFDGVKKARDQRIGKRNIGFADRGTEKTDSATLTAEDFCNQGFSKEFLGRFSVIIEYNELSDSVLREILTTSKLSPWVQSRKLFSKIYNMNIELPEDCIDKLIKEAKSKGTGARGLITAVDAFTKEKELEALKLMERELISEWG